MQEKLQRFLPFIEGLIVERGYPYPPELITAVIWIESRGNIGALNPKSGASGLMQIMPIALKDYNERSGNPVLTMSHMRSKEDASFKDQIRVGMWILGRFWKSAHKYLKPKLGKVSIPDLIKIADTFYAAGPGRMKGLLDPIAAPTFANAELRYPNSNALGHARKVWEKAISDGAIFNQSKIDSWMGDKPDVPITPPDPDVVPLIPSKSPIDGAIIALILIGIVWALWGAKGDKHATEQ